VESLRNTRGPCPVCHQIVEAVVLVDDAKVYLEKRCPEHGNQRELLSHHPAYFRELTKYYFAAIPPHLPQRDYILRLTGRCNMACPICLASANDYTEDDLPMNRIREFIRGRKRLKLDLMGAEPTLRDDLPDIIRLAKARGHITALHTNGIKTADPHYLDTLVRAGLDEVHLQFDGFSEEHDRLVRGRSMREAKERTINNLSRHGLATDLVVTIVKESNEREMLPVLEFAASRPFIKEVFYLGCRKLGRATDDFNTKCLPPDVTIDMLVEQSQGAITREDIRVFQKIYFAALAVFRVRKCFYIHHYLVLRTADGYKPIATEIDFPYLEPKLDRFLVWWRKSKLLALPYLAIHILLAILKKHGFALLRDGLMLSLLMLFGFNLSKIKSRPLLLGFISACDPWTHDVQIAANCGKGEISTDVGDHEAGADANVARENIHRQSADK